MSTEKILENLLKFCIPTVVSAFVAVIVLPLVSRVYPEAEYGYISNFYSVGTLLMGAVFLGLDQAYIRFFNEPPEGADRNGMFQFVFASGLVVTLGVFLIALCAARSWLSGLLFNEQSPRGVILLGVYVLALCGYRMCNINFRFSNNIKAYNLQQVAYILGNRLLFVSAALYSTRYIASTAVMAALTIGLALVSLISQRGAFKGGFLSPQARNTLIRFALPLMPAAIIVQLNTSIAKLILGGYGLRDDVGILALATSAANIFSVIPNAFAVYWGPFMYQYYKSEQEKIKSAHNIIMMLSIILVIGVVVFQDVIYLVLGEGYRSSQAYFLLIMLSPITTLLGETTSYGINLAGKTKYTFFATLSGCLSNILACAFLIPRIGGCGAAVGVGLSATVIFALRTIVGQRYYVSVPNKWKTLGGCAIIWGLCIGNVWLSAHMLLRLAFCAAALGLWSWSYRKSIAAIGKSIVAHVKKVR